MKLTVSDKIKDLLLLLLVTIVAYWPVSFMVLSLKNDAINYFLAMRYNVSEAIQYGYFPSWSPYINMGYPLHGDMQSGVWNPLAFLMSLIRKYDIYWLHVETILVIYLSGVSMYHLLKHFKLERKIILTVSVAYMLNGYITDAGQFLNWLYAAAILPFVFLFAVRCFSELNSKSAFLLGVAHSLMLLCSYPADFILLSYLLFAFMLFSFFRQKKKNGSLQTIKIFGKQLLISSVTFIVICLPAILSYAPFIQSINRGSGIDIETALMNSLSPANLISFITPWPTQQGEIFQPTDPLIRNCYIGIILFIFFLNFLFQKTKKTFLEKFLIGTFLFFLLFSLGRSAGLRVLSYYTLPLMDTFRHPANAKLFFLFAGQLLAAFAIRNYFNNPAISAKHIKKISLFALGLAGVLSILSFINSNILSAIRYFFIHAKNNIAETLKYLKEGFSFYDFLFLNTIVLIVILIAFFLLTKKDKLQKYIMPLVFIEMFIIAQGMLPLTYVRKSPPSAVQQILEAQPKGYPLPDTQISIEDYSRDGMKYFETIGCLNPYNKKPGRSDYVITPSNLSTQEAYWDYTGLKNKVNKYPLAYFADTIYKISDTLSFISSTSKKKAVLLEDDKSAPALIHQGLGGGPIRFKKFVPGKFEIQTENSRPGVLSILQNHYPNWRVYVNGKKAQILKANLSFMAVVLPSGKNNVEFVYQSNYLKYLAVFSVLFLFAGIFLFVYKKNPS